MGCFIQSVEISGVRERVGPVQVSRFGGGEGPHAVATLVVGLVSSALAQKTDVVHMSNGNVFVGEVKKLELGLQDFFWDKGQLYHLFDSEPRDSGI